MTIGSMTAKSRRLRTAGASRTAPLALAPALIVCALALAAPTFARAEAALRVVATTPDLGALVPDASRPSTRPAPVRPWHRFFMRKLLGLVGKPPLVARLWDGQEIRVSDAPPVAAVVFHNAAVLRRMALNPFYQFCEAYTNGQIDVLGDLVEAILSLDRSLRTSQSAQFLYNLLSNWLRLPNFNTLSASRDNVHHHYDIGNDFYRLWLDERMVYTCAYFPTPDATLEEAQVAKLEHVCRKLALAPGERVIEAALLNPHMTEALVAKTLMRDEAPDALVLAVCHHPKWSLPQDVRVALMRNPKTPLASMLAITQSLPTAVLREVLLQAPLEAKLKRYLILEMERREGRDGRH